MVKLIIIVVFMIEEEVIWYVNILFYNNIRILIYEYDVDFVCFVLGVNNGKWFDLKFINVNLYVYIINLIIKCLNLFFKNNVNISILILIKSELDNFYLW